ncbi:glycosyltransferase family 2 protein [Ruegeria sp. HKCCD7255]|uniref:glycosyltransferase family 2 protein n=1 Tax=Ruegeria sp. HKCCD7255 TaxID=2683004 RepID=UPI0014877D81|nr:glycosyltransferase family 2 protein [Ruegeria sp. HKCCD7255]
MSKAVTQIDPSASPRVSIIVVSYNTKDMTLECLRSVQEQTQVPYELIVVDNASTDGSPEAIATEFPDIELMAEKDNHGFALANNIAALRARGEYLLLLNPDTVVLDHAINHLIEFADKNPQARIWGGKTYYGDMSLNPTNAWNQMTLWGVISQALGFSSVFRKSDLFNPEAIPGWDRDSEYEVDIVTGCFFLIKRDFWQELDGFDKAFFMYGEEADLCLRARAKGARPRITPTAQIIHYAGASEKVRSDKMVRLLRAKMTLIQHHFPKWQRGIGQSMFRLWPWSRMVGLKLLRRQEAATVWGEIWHRRKEWQDGY